MFRSLKAAVFGKTVVFGLFLLLFAKANLARAEVCTTQSQMKEAERLALSAAARGLAQKVQANDAAGVRSEMVAEYATDFEAIRSVLASTAPHLQGASAQVEGVYLLDAEQMKLAAGAKSGDAQFFCSLNRSQAEVDFLIPGLTPGRYGFALVGFSGSATPWRVSFLLRQEGGRWLMAGLYQEATTAAGHDGLWYWTEARRLAAAKERWDAWIYFRKAEQLMRPAEFVRSSHLEKLEDEQRSDAPPALSSGVSAETPLIVKGADGAEYRFTDISADDAMSHDKVDLVAHLRVEATGDPVAARKRNLDAMRALLAAYPELRQAFHGVWMFADATGGAPFATEQSMAEIH